MKFIIVLEVLTNTVRQEKEVKVTWVRKEGTEHGFFFVENFIRKWVKETVNVKRQRLEYVAD